VSALACPLVETDSHRHYHRVFGVPSAHSSAEEHHESRTCRPLQSYNVSLTLTLFPLHGHMLLEKDFIHKTDFASDFIQWTLGNSRSADLIHSLHSHTFRDNTHSAVDGWMDGPEHPVHKAWGAHSICNANQEAINTLTPLKSQFNTG